MASGVVSADLDAGAPFASALPYPPGSPPAPHVSAAAASEADSRLIVLADANAGAPLPSSLPSPPGSPSAPHMSAAATSEAGPRLPVGTFEHVWVGTLNDPLCDETLPVWKRARMLNTELRAAADRYATGRFFIVMRTTQSAWPLPLDVYSAMLANPDELLVRLRTGADRTPPSHLRSGNVADFVLIRVVAAVAWCSETLVRACIDHVRQFLRVIAAFRLGRGGRITERCQLVQVVLPSRC